MLMITSALAADCGGNIFTNVFMTSIYAFAKFLSILLCRRKRAFFVWRAAKNEVKRLRSLMSKKDLKGG